jgi:hypothetical protein
MRASFRHLGLVVLFGCQGQSADLMPVLTETPDSGSSFVDAGPDAGLGCNLGVSPAALDFGNVIVSSTITDHITLWNDGGAACDVSGIALAPGSDSYFSLPASQATAISVEALGTSDVAVSFTAFGNVLPFLRRGTLIFQVDDPENPSRSIPLSAYINHQCSPAAQAIYTVDIDGWLSAFHPETLSFDDIGFLHCPVRRPNVAPPPGVIMPPITPISMDVDQDAVAWVLYTNGELFKVDTATAACTATGFQAGQQGFWRFGMGSVFDQVTGQDTLFIAGGLDWNSPPNLGTISFPSLTVTTVGPLSMGPPELAGTGDGELWAFTPVAWSPTYVATLAQIDPASGAILSSVQYPSLTTLDPFSMKFYGGSFWIFIGSAVYAVDRETLTLTTAIPPGNGREICGAGVSTCAPVQ